MILRRLTQSLKEQNWTAIVIEFVLLVVGVFLGIQVSNWNDANNDRLVVDKYLADITADVRSDIDELARTRRSALSRISASTYLLRQAGVPIQKSGAELTQPDQTGIFAGFEQVTIPEVAVPPASQRSHLWQAITTVYMYDPNRSAYDALVSSGRIELIDDPRITRALREYYFVVTSLALSQQRTIAPIKQQVIDAGIAHGHAAWGNSDEAVLVEQVRREPAFAAMVATSRQLSGYQLLMCNVNEKKARELLSLLEKRSAP